MQTPADGLVVSYTLDRYDASFLSRVFRMTLPEGQVVSFIITRVNHAENNCGIETVDGEILLEQGGRLYREDVMQASKASGEKGKWHSKATAP